MLTNYTYEDLEMINYNFFIKTWFLISCLTIFFNIVLSHKTENIENNNIYKSKYYDEFLELDHEDLNDDKKKLLEESFIKHLTEDEITIIMNYSFINETFQYWCDNNISFHVLDSLAQLYAIEYNCKSVCVDYKKELEKLKDEVEKENENETEKQQDNDNTKSSPFATFKSYNKTTDRVTKNLNRKNAVPESCNHFRRKGSLNDFNCSNGKWVNSIKDEYTEIWIDLPKTPDKTETCSYSEWKIVNNYN